MIDVAILGIDPGEHAGAALVRDNRVVWSTSARPGDEARLVARALELPAGVRLFVFAEKWTSHGPFGGARTQRGLGRAWGRWEGALLGAKVPKARVTRVYPRTWQAAVVSGTQLKRAMMEHLSERVAIAGGADPGLPPDAYAAACIALYGWRLTHRERLARGAA